MPVWFQIVFVLLVGLGLLGDLRRNGGNTASLDPVAGGELSSFGDRRPPEITQAQLRRYVLDARIRRRVRVRPSDLFVRLRDGEEWPLELVGARATRPGDPRLN